MNNPNILSCPKCQSKKVNIWKSEGGIFELSLFTASCPDCKYEMESLSSGRGTKIGAISEWNNIVKEIHILNHLNKNESFAFDNGIDILEFIENYNFTQRQLSITLNALAKIYLLEKFSNKAYDIDGLKNGTRYNSYSITEHGVKRLERLNREYRITLK